MSTPAGDDLVGNATIRVDGDTDPALRALNQFSRDAQGRMRDVRGRFVSESAAINRTLTNAATGGNTLTTALTNADDRGNRFGHTLRTITNAATAAGGVLGRVGLGLGAIGAAAGTAAPLLAGIVTTLENIAPAGAVAVTGMLAVTQASAAIKLSMVGVEDAVTAAFDTSEAGAKKFDEALKKLAPNARAFAEQIRALQPAFQKFQQGVQNRVFAGFADELKGLSSTVLPLVRTNLNATADTLNKMALGASGAARQLATSGTLGTAMAGANKGLANLRTIPGQVVTALGQLAAAGTPAFGRLTAGAAGAAARIGDRLSKAFESGALTSAVDTAIGLLKDLGTVAANVFSTLGNIMAPVQAAGGGLIGMLVQITGALKNATGTQAFQTAISSLAQVMGTLARTVGPLVGQALAAIAPVLSALGPPAQTLITALGAGLEPIITALGPVLLQAAAAVGALVTSLAPLLPVVGQLAAALLPALTPLLAAIRRIFEALAPVVAQVSSVLQATLAPVLAQLPGIIQPLADLLANQLIAAIQLFGDLLVQVSPALISLGQSAGLLLAAAAPLIAVMAQLTTQLLGGLLPALQPIIGLVASLANTLASQLASTLTNLIIPTLQLVSNLLRGDFTAAWNSLKSLVSGVATHFTTTLTNIYNVVASIVRSIVERFTWLYNVLIGNSIIPDLVNGIVSWFGRLPGMVFSALAGLASRIVARAVEAGSALVSTLQAKVAEAVNWVRGLPGRAAGALGALAGALRGQAASAGASLVAAIREKVASAVAAVREMPGRAAAALGGLGGRLASAGADLIRGMIGGIRSMAGALVAAAKDVVGSAVSAAKNLLGIASPSKVFAEIGRNVGQGFINGLTSTKSKIDQTADRMAAAVVKAFKGTGSKVDDRLVNLIQSGNKRLQSLADERDKLSARIAQAQKFATDLATSTASGFSLQNVLGSDPLTAGNLKQNLGNAAIAIKAFTSDVSQLKKLGLRKDLIQQILDLGVEQGAQLADTLAKQSPAYIKQLNKMQANVVNASQNLGRLGADALFDAGKKAGDGFLTGLKAQKKSIEALMLDIAKSIQGAIKKALGIKSPSRVFAEIGANTARGLAEGLLKEKAGVQATVRTVAGSVTDAGADSIGSMVGLTRASSRPTSTTFVNHFHLENRGVLGSQREAEDWLTRAMDRLRLQGRLPRGVAA
ncbi:phage tail protein [Streptomyces sp. YKOK-I1]